jgi:hypothetical protein
MTSKNKIVFSALGGVFLVGAGVLGWLLLDKISFADQVAQELADEEGKYDSCRVSKVFPCRATLASIETNALHYAEWFDASMKTVSKADAVPSVETPAAFKQRLSSAVGRMKSLPGGLDGRIAAQTFLFGFDQYLGENPTMPSDKDVPRLAAELDTIVHIVDLLSEAGIVEVRKIARLNNSNADEQSVQQQGRRRQQKKKAVKEDNGPKTTELKYEIEFTTRPSGLVDAVNMLSSDVKFITIENFAMKATADTIADKFAASDSAKATQSAGSGRRRRGRAAAATGAFASDMDKNAQEPAAAHRLVVDPESDAPISVTMTLKVTDFGRPVRSVAAQAQQPAANDAAKAAQPEKEDK